MEMYNVSRVIMIYDELCKYLQYLQDEQRLKVICIEASPLDHAQNAKRVIQEVKDMLSRPSTT